MIHNMHEWESFPVISVRFFELLALLTLNRVQRSFCLERALPKCRWMEKCFHDFKSLTEEFTSSLFSDRNWKKNQKQKVILTKITGLKVNIQKQLDRYIICQLFIMYIIHKLIVLIIIGKFKNN